jgi:hypothetical protein
MHDHGDEEMPMLSPMTCTLRGMYSFYQILDRPVATSVSSVIQPHTIVSCCL